MKARLLKKLLGNPGYIVSNHDDYIAIGSPLCHDLIKIIKGTFKMTYALSINYGDHRSELLNKPQLLAIWDKLKEIIASGEINDIINGNDELDNHLPVYTIEDGVLICTTTDAYGWPNTTVEGHLMYNNTYFKTVQGALKYGIRDEKAYIKLVKERIERLKKELFEAKDLLAQHRLNLKSLKGLLPGHPSDTGIKES